MATRNIHYCEFCGDEFIETKQMKEESTTVYFDLNTEGHEACSNCVKFMRDGIKNQNWGIFKLDEM